MLVLEQSILFSPDSRNFVKVQKVFPYLFINSFLALHHLISTVCDQHHAMPTMTAIMTGIQRPINHFGMTQSFRELARAHFSPTSSESISLANFVATHSSPRSQSLHCY